MVNELVRLDADRRPLAAIYPEIESHPVPEIVGEIDYDGAPSNRFQIGYFGMLRARLIALWAAEEISGKQLNELLGGVSRSNIDSDPFTDESKANADDDTIIEMFDNLTGVNRLFRNCGVEWIEPFHAADGYANYEVCETLANYLLKAVAILKTEPIRMLSDEQIDAYGSLADFLLESPNGVGIL